MPAHGENSTIHLGVPPSDNEVFEFAFALIDVGLCRNIRTWFSVPRAIAREGVSRRKTLIFGILNLHVGAAGVSKADMIDSWDKVKQRQTSRGSLKNNGEDAKRSDLPTL